MGSRDSGCFVNSILSNNSQINNESTPIKKSKNWSAANKNETETLLLFTPIKSQRPTELSCCLNQSIDIDSVYFSRLKRPKHNIYSQQYSPVSSFASSSRRISDFRLLEYSISDFSQSDSIKIDFLFELHEKSMFHVIKLILNNLSNKDYTKLNGVSKNWQIILNQDLIFNKQRKQAIKKEINFYKTEKVNIFFNFFVSN
jgi:hypothetical protein